MGTMHNQVRKAARRKARHAERGTKLVHDQAVLDQTATGSPCRIDDETKEIPLAPAVADGSRYAGEL